VLSVGWGLGHIEHSLRQLHAKRIDLHVQDYATKSLRWLRLVMPAENIYDATEVNKVNSGNMASFIFNHLIMHCKIPSW
jgi:hypothetical protein